jgi:hypothetical protein
MKLGWSDKPRLHRGENKNKLRWNTKNPPNKKQ